MFNIDMNKEFEHKVVTSVAMDKKEEDILEEIRWREHKTMSKVIRKAIQEYIGNHKDGNNSFKLDEWNNNPEFRAVPTLMSNKDIWRTYYTDSNPQDRTELRLKVNELVKLFQFIEYNKK